MTVEIGKNLADFLNNLMVGVFIMIIFYGVFYLMTHDGEDEK